jgi:hypothetical protein
MSDELPDPLVPADADLRNFPFTPIFRSRLFGSSFHARVNDSEWRAGVTLWLKSWDQVPAGSLPNDDIDLCRLAELGRDMKAWKRIRENALRGWFLCKDGRLYHAVVAEGINEALEGKDAQRARTLKARLAALRKRLAETSDTEQCAHLTEEIERLSQGSVTDSNRKRNGKGQGNGNGEGQGKGLTGEVSPVPPPTPSGSAVVVAARPPARDMAAAKEGKSSATFDAYAAAYRERYGVDPVRHRTVNSQLCSLVDKLGATEAPQVAAFYVRHNRGLYVSSRHCVDLLVRDADGLRTEWATGRTVTDTGARLIDATQQRGDAFGQLLNEATK